MLKNLKYYKRKYGSNNIWKLMKRSDGIFVVPINIKNRGKIQKDIDAGRMKIITNLNILVSKNI